MPSSAKDVAKAVYRCLARGLGWLHPNLAGALHYPPGHYHSPLLDLNAIAKSKDAFLAEDEKNWAHIDFNAPGQLAIYRELLAQVPRLAFPGQKRPGWRYYSDNDFFLLFDAFTLAGLLRKFRPGRIVEVGSGFSTAVILDTLESASMTAALTLIEPDPRRLFSLLRETDRGNLRIESRLVQQVDLTAFAALNAGDFLIIDSSHILKTGSDVTFLLLQVMPRLKPGVIVHFHDIFYPYSYPWPWTMEGRAWNESHALRAFLIFNPAFRMIAFNSYAGVQFKELFASAFPELLQNTGGSLWLEKIA